MFVKVPLLLVLNVISVFLLLWFLLVMNSAVNDHFFPGIVQRTTALLIIARFLALFIEAGGWLAAMFAVNTAFLRSVRGIAEPKKIAAYIFFCEYAIVVSIICLFFYNVFWVQW